MSTINDNSFQGNKSFSIIDQKKKMKDGEILKYKTLNILLDKSEKSICEIKSNSGNGTGFFCVLKYPDNPNNIIYCLITNYHVIDDNFLNSKECIEIKMNNNEMKLHLINKRRLWSNKEIDFTCIEIIKEDNLIEKITPFDINENCYNNNFNNEDYNKNGIILSAIGTSKDIEISQGAIYYMENNNNIFYHNCNIEEGYSGGPIILINNLSIIGINKGYDRRENKNIGIYFSSIINSIKNEKNEIICILNIDENDYKEDIILLNNNKDNKKEFIDNINVYIKENKIDIKNEGNQWKINYNFQKKGKYEIRIIFNRKLTNLRGIFENCKLLYSIDLSGFNTSKVTDMKSMFDHCVKLEKIIGLEKLDTNEVINMKAMFQLCGELEELDLSNFNTSKVTDMGYMFAMCVKLKKINGLERFNTNQVINMHVMFGKCTELEELDLSNFNTSKVTDMTLMFNDCIKLKKIKGIEKFNTNQVINMKAMFDKCKELEELDLSNFNTSKVTDMMFMFADCIKIKRIKGLTNFNTNKVIKMSEMFRRCYELEELDLSNFNTSNAIDMKYMFGNCQKLKLLDISKFNIESGCDIKSIFDSIKKDCKIICKDNTLNKLYYSK